MMITKDRAIEVLQDELKHTRHHLQYEGKSEEYYKEMGEIADSLEMAIEFLKNSEELVELRSQRASECEWCKGCKEHDEENHCCHRLSNFIHTQAKEIHDMAYEEGKNDRPKGKWLTIEDRNGEVVLAECSKCGRQVQVLSNYCPNCGADMRGEKNE